MTKYFSMGVAMVRQWLPEALGPAPQATTKQVGVELNGTVGIECVGDNHIEASIAGDLHAREGGDPLHDKSVVPIASDVVVTSTLARVEARRSSSGKLAQADPFVWLQLLDDNGAPLTHETFLGKGVGKKYQVRARIEVPAIAEAVAAKPAMRGARDRRRLASGLCARLVTRTYRNPSGPRYHTEVLLLPLLPAGTDLPMPTARPAPALALVPALASDRGRAAAMHGPARPN
jgi:hypothetical protein